MYTERLCPTHLYQMPPIKVQKSKKKRRWEDCKSQRFLTTPRKQHFPYTKELMYIWTHRLWQHALNLQKLKPYNILALRRKHGHRVPLLMKKLLATVKRGKTSLLQ